jgi:hypothetical protein
MAFLYVTDEETNEKINIDELYEKNHRRDLKQLSVFNKLLARIHKRITTIGKTKLADKHIWFNVPEYIFGEPVYDKSECIAYLVIIYVTIQLYYINLFVIYVIFFPFYNYF